IDKKEYVLLKALVVCNPAIEGLSTSHKTELEKEQLKYSKSLLSYVIWRRGHQDGPLAYIEIMSLIDFLTHLMKNHKNFHILREAMNPKTGQPKTLLNDIYEY
ncbi:hypothetical protein PMAYCL1PPCAC_15474, partial [Pristionchus mayeri]